MAKKGLSAIKGFFFEDDEQGKPATPATATVSDVLASPTQPTSGQVDDSIRQDLLKAMEQNNLEGYDYFEFRQALKNMEKVLPVETDRFKAAFAAVASLVSPENLVKTAQHYVDVLKTKSSEFDKYVAKVRAERVTGKEEQATQADANIQATQNQIDLLNKEIADMKLKKAQLQNEALAEKAKIDAVALNFGRTVQEVMGQITSDINKIQTYLEGGSK